MSIIWDDADALAYFLDKFSHSRPVMTSAPCDLIHVGHVRCIRGCKNFGRPVIVVVNGDNFLIRKKGYYLMPLAERMEIVAALEGVDHVVAWDDGSQNVAGAIERLRPKVFAKGGDRSCPENMDKDELAVCERLGVKIEYGVGGFEKANSSSWLVEKIRGLSNNVQS